MRHAEPQKAFLPAGGDLRADHTRKVNTRSKRGFHFNRVAKKENSSLILFVLEVLAWIRANERTEADTNCYTKVARRTIGRLAIPLPGRTLHHALAGARRIPRSIDSGTTCHEIKIDRRSFDSTSSYNCRTCVTSPTLVSWYQDMVRKLGPCQLISSAAQGCWMLKWFPHTSLVRIPNSYRISNPRKAEYSID